MNILTEIITKGSHKDLPIIDLQLGLMDTVRMVYYKDSIDSSI